MKLFVSILSLYVLALTAIPCIDAAHDNIDCATEQSQPASDNHAPGDDHCSPFCTCQCCATPVVFVNYTIQLTCFSFTQKMLSGYTPTYFSTLHNAIWQPPKVS